MNITLPAGPPDEVAARAREGLSEGYACFKLKVGLPGDEERVAAVREAVGPWPALRLDANAAWWVDEAVRSIRSLERHDLEFIEQPCRTLEELAEVRERVSTRSQRTRRWRPPRTCAARSSWRPATWST